MEKSANDNRDLFAKNIYDKSLKVPKKLDLRKDLNRIRDQGKSAQCGAFAAATIKEWQENKQIGLKGFFSVDYIYDRRQHKEGSGMNARNIMKILHKKGAVPDTMFTNSSCDDVIADGFKIKGYAQVKTIEECKKALYKNGPCLISFPMYNRNSERMWDSKEGDGNGHGGHAMVVVGYDEEGFIIRNSFGEKWGKKGYCWYPYADWGAHWEIWTTIDDKSEMVHPVHNCLGGIGMCFGR